MQYMIKYALENEDDYILESGNDTVIDEVDCYCVKTILDKKALMPGFYKSIIDTNRVETMILYIGKSDFYPRKMRLEVFFIDNPKIVYYTDNNFYNIEFNLKLNDSLFLTSNNIVKGFKINEITN
jgi:hypothetical protein